MRTLITILSIFLFINECHAQESTKVNMINIDYQHSTPPSFESRIIQTSLGLFGMKRKSEKKMITDNFPPAPSKLPKSLLRNFNIEEVKQNNRKVWTISPKEGKTDVVILYLHGGAYMGNIIKQHWNFIEQLAIRTDAVIIVPDYPLAPGSTCKETFNFIRELYNGLRIDNPNKRIIFMGDSAGGGLAMGFVQELRNENLKQPDDIILFSPWLDITMTNPDLQILDKEDKMLSIKGLKSAGQKYAGNLDLEDYRVSPLYGNLTGICRISIFTGTKDILNADARKYKQLMNDQLIGFNYFEYPGMFHDWVVITSLKESHDVIMKVVNIVHDYHVVTEL